MVCVHTKVPKLSSSACCVHLFSQKMWPISAWFHRGEIYPPELSHTFPLSLKALAYLWFTQQAPSPRLYGTCWELTEAKMNQTACSMTWMNRSLYSFLYPTGKEGVICCQPSALETNSESKLSNPYSLPPLLWCRAGSDLYITLSIRDEGWMPLFKLEHIPCSTLV